jgi:hypothetical protein
MISDVVAWLFAALVIDPLQVELRERFDGANLPMQALQQSQQCIASHGPRLLAQAGDRPGWAAATAISITFGWSSPVSLFDMHDPNCSTLVQLFNVEAKPEAEENV